MIIFTIIILIIFFYLFKSEHKMYKELDIKNEQELKRLKGAKIGTKVKIIEGEHYGETGMIVGYGLARSLEIKLDKGTFLPLFFTENVELI